MSNEHKTTGIPEKTKTDYRINVCPACSLRRGMAFTLAELLMALTITALIGMSVATVSTALSSAQASTDNMTEALSSGRYAMRSIDADVRKAGLITATGNGEMVIWTGDKYDDKQINISELVLIRFDSDNKTIKRWQVVFPDSMHPGQLAALNTSVLLSQIIDTQDVMSLLTRKMRLKYLTHRVMAVDVSNFEVVTDEAPPMPQLVLLRMTAGQDAQQITLTNTAHLRADATGCVSFDEDGIPVLDLGADDDKSGSGGRGDDDKSGGGGKGNRVRHQAKPFM